MLRHGASRNPLPSGREEVNIREDPLRCGASRLLVFHTAGKRFPSPDFPIRERNQQKNWRESWNRVLQALEDRKSTRLNSSHSQISYAVFCLKKKTGPSHKPPNHHSQTSRRRRGRPLVAYASACDPRSPGKAHPPSAQLSHLSAFKQNASRQE